MKSKQNLSALAWLQSCSKAGEGLARSPGEDRARDLLDLHSERMGGSGDKLQEGSSQLDSRKKNIHHEGGRTLLLEQKGCEVPILAGVHNTTERADIF